MPEIGGLVFWQPKEPDLKIRIRSPLHVFLREIERSEHDQDKELTMLNILSIIPRYWKSKECLTIRQYPFKDSQDIFNRVSHLFEQLVSEIETAFASLAQLSKVDFKNATFKHKKEIVPFLFLLKDGKYESMKHLLAFDDSGFKRKSLCEKYLKPWWIKHHKTETSKTWKPAYKN